MRNRGSLTSRSSGRSFDSYRAESTRGRLLREGIAPSSKDTTRRGRTKHSLGSGWYTPFPDCGRFKPMGLHTVVEGLSDDYIAGTWGGREGKKCIEKGAFDIGVLVKAARGSSAGGSLEMNVALGVDSSGASLLLRGDVKSKTWSFLLVRHSLV